MRTRLVIPVIVLLLLAAVVLLLLTDPWSTTGQDFQTLFPRKTEEVQHILVIDEYDSLEFIRNDTTWFMGEEELNSEAVDNLLYATELLRLTAILPHCNDVMQEGFTEFIMSGSRRVLGHFYFGKTINGYAVCAPGTDRAFGVEMAGYEEYFLEKIFSGNRDHYRQHLVLNLLPSEIRSVAVYPHHGTPFRAEQDMDYHISVTELEGMRQMTEHVDERKIRMLFSFFNAIRYNGVIPEENIEPGMMGAYPYATVEVTEFDGTVHSIIVYQWTKPGEDAPDIFEAIVVFSKMPGYRSMNFYYLDLLMRGLEEYRIQS